MLLAVHFARSPPERGDGEHALQSGKPYHQVVKGIPRQAALGHHSRGEQRPYGCT